MLTCFVPMSPLAPLAEQVALETNTAPLKGANTVVAAATIFVLLQGGVVDLTAPHRAAALTDTCNRLSVHIIQPVCIMPNINKKTGRPTKANSTAVVP